MKKELLVFMLLASCTSATLQAQDSLQLKKKIIYKIKLQQQRGELLEGFLKQVTDSSVVYSLSKITYGAMTEASDRTVHYSKIKDIKIRRSGKTGRAIAVGAGIGVATGAIIGLASGDDPPSQGFQIFGPITAGEKAAGLGIGLGVTGAFLGALSSIGWRKYDINGRKEILVLLRTEVQNKGYGVSFTAANQ